MEENNDKNRNNVILELYQTELSYVEDLQLLLELYVQPIRSNTKGWIKNDINQLFSNLTVIAGVNKVLKEDLKKENLLPPEKQNIGAIFLKLADYLKMYTQYCGEQTVVVKSITDQRRDKSFNEFLEDVKFNNPKSKGLDINQFLIKPVQRICKYPLLLEQLLKYTSKSHPDYDNLHQAIQKMGTVVNDINKGRRQLETYHKASFLQVEIERVINAKFQLMKIGRFYIREGDFQKISGPKLLQQRLYLFNDLLIYGKILNPNKKNERFKYKGHVYLSRMVIENLAENEVTPKYNNENAFKFARLDGKEMKKYILVAKSKEEKYLWKNEFEELIEESKKRTDQRMSLVISMYTESSDTSIKESTEDYVEKLTSKEDKLIHYEKNSKKEERKERKAALKELDLLSFYESEDDSSVISSVKIEEKIKNDFETYPSLSKVPTKYSSFYSTLISSARKFEKNETVELLLLGEKSSGKSSLFEAITGVPLLPNEETKAVIYFKMLNNPEQEKPRIVIKSKIGNFVFRSLDEFKNRIREKMLKPKKNPIYITYESKECWNVTVIDTPAFDINKEESVSQILKLTRHPHRKILCVIPTKPPSCELTLFDFIKQNLDPNLSRTIFLRTKFQLYVHFLSEQHKLDTFYKQTVGISNSFFLSCFSKFTREDVKDQSQLDQLLLKNDSLLYSTVNKLGFDHSSMNRIGVSKFRKYLVGLLFDHEMGKIISNVPSLISKKITFINNEIDSLSNMEKVDLKTQHFKHSLSNYSSRFYKAIDVLLNGNISYSSPKTGYTLEEEKSHSPLGHWLPPFIIETGEDDVLFEKCRMGPGGAHLQRVISEFKSVSNSIKLEFSEESLIPHVDKFRQSEISHQIAQNSIRSQFESIICNFLQRLNLSCSQISDTAFSIAESEVESSKYQSFGSYYSLERYSHTSLFLKQQFTDFIQKRLDIWRDRSLEFLHLDRFPCWKINNFINLDFVPKYPLLGKLNDDEIKNSIHLLATELFNELKQEIIQKCLTDLYEIFLSPLLTSNQLIYSIHSSISSLNEKDILELFHLDSLKKEIRSSVLEKEKEKNLYAEMKKEFSSCLENFYQLREILI
eukprot:TRINITY_DN4238_c0_g2_i1.p1 TRINITY_DN4238_c0_g2~~TRINITY_DN4238_c0_g2_i1.p1  ORF type:complete len:1088 (+),score=361.01 TRINITY_DN4238_c0_g2_i1:73-3336(+)